MNLVSEVSAFLEYEVTVLISGINMERRQHRGILPPEDSDDSMLEEIDADDPDYEPNEVSRNQRCEVSSDDEADEEFEEDSRNNATKKK